MVEVLMKSTLHKILEDSYEKTNFVSLLAIKWVKNCKKCFGNVTRTALLKYCKFAVGKKIPVTKTVTKIKFKLLIWFHCFWRFHCSVSSSSIYSNQNICWVVHFHLKIKFLFKNIKENIQIAFMKTMQL